MTNNTSSSDAGPDLKLHHYDAVTILPADHDNNHEEKAADPVDDAAIQVSGAPVTILVVDEPLKSIHPHWCLAVLVLLMSVLSSVGEQQFLKNAFSENFNAPFFILFVSNFIRVFTLPCYVAVVWLRSRLQGPRRSLRQILSYASIFESNEPLWIFLIKTTGILTSNILLITSLATMALAYATVSECAAVMTTQVAMFYFVAVAFLGHRVLIVKLLAVIISLGGVGVIAYAKGFRSSSAIGIGLTMISTIIFAFNITYYKILYKKLNFGQCCSFLSSTALYTLVVFWWLPVWTSISGVEYWEWTTIPWTVLVLSSACQLLTAISLNIGLSLATPLLMSFTSLLRIPCNVFVDVWLRKVDFTELEVVGSVLIVVGFLVIVIPDHRVSLQIKAFFRCFQK